MTPHTVTASHPARRIPGESGTWVFLFGDMLGQILRHEVEPLVHEGAGQGVVHLTVQEPVADIMERLVREADEVLAKLGG